MKRYKIIIHSTAKADERDIIQYLRAISPSVAKYYHRTFADAFRSLDELPLRCPPARNEEYARKGYHYLVVGNYLVFFTVSDDTVRIRRIIDGRSNYL